MSIDEFNELTIDEQVDLLNGMLKEMSWSEVAKKIGIDRSALKRRIERKGYKKIENQFVVDEDTKPTTEVTKENTKPTTSSKKIKENNKSESKKVDFDIIKRIELLEKQVNELQKLLQEDKSMNIDNYKHGKSVVRSFRLYPKVFEELEHLKKIYKNEFTTQELINRLLVEGMNKYKKN